MTRGRPFRRLRMVELLEPRLLLAGDPLAEWRFDSSSGTVLVDSVGAADGTVTGSSVFNSAGLPTSVMPVWTASNPNQWGTGTQNGGLRLFSDTDGALVSSDVAPDVLSVSLWFKADTTRPMRYDSTSGTVGSTSGNVTVAMPLFEVGDSSRGLNIYVYNNRLYAGAWNSSVAGWSNGTFLFSASNAIVAGRWHHVVVTLDPTATLEADALRGYLDGAQFGVGQGAQIGGDLPIGIGRADGTTRFLLGTAGSSVASNNAPASNNNRGFAGYIDEARVYNETLTAADVSMIRDATAPTVPEEVWLTRDSGRSMQVGRFRVAGQLASEHFIMKWGNNPLPTINGQAGGNLVNGVQQNLNRLEQSWDIIVEQSGMAPPRQRNGVGYKVNVYVLETGLWIDFAGAFAGPDPEGFSALYVSPWALGGGTSNIAPWGTVANTTVTPHEFTHVLQNESQGFANSDFSGPFWETHANLGASLVSDVVTRNSINGRYGQRRHRYSLATDFRYEAHPFLNFLSTHPNYGPQFVTSGLWSDVDAQGGNKDPWQVLRNNFASFNEFASVYAEYVASSVTYRSLHNGALLGGSPAIPAHNTTQRLFRTYLEPVGSSPGWYQVPEQDTPEQYGANIIKLTPVDRMVGQPHTITVNLDGYVNPGQSSGVYATLVAISPGGERYSATWTGGETSFELAANETDVYLAVTAIPSIHRNYIWSHTFHAIGGLQKIERFPYRVSMTGAVPVRSEVEGARPLPPVSGARHTNPDQSIGGFVASTAFVAPTAYIGFNAQVLNTARVEGTARVDDYATVQNNARVQGSAIVRGHARVRNSAIVTGSAIVEDYADIAGGTISEFARVKGDALVNAGQIRGNALLMDYATVSNGSTVIAADTVVKGYGVVDNAQMNGNALVASSGLAAGAGLVTAMGVQYNGEPASQEVPLMTTQYNNLFARYDFAAQDNNAVWDTFNTTYGWVSDTPPQWIASSPTGGNPLAGVLQFASDDQFIELSPELADLREYTIATWVRWDGTGDANQRIFEFGRDGDNYMYLQPSSDGGTVKFVIAVDGTEHVLEGAAPLATNQWQHVAVTFSGDTVKLRVNVTAVATLTGVDVDPHYIRSTYGLLGRGLGGGGFHGLVHSLRVYSKALAFNEVLALVQQVLPGYVPDPDPGPGPGGSEAILVLEFAVHDNSGLPVQDRQAITNGDLRNSSPVAPGESTSPGGMTSSSASYSVYNVAIEGLSDKPGADGFAMNTVNGYVYFADAGSLLEQALATSDTFAAFARVKRLNDSGSFELIVGRPDIVEPTGAWSIGVDANDRIVASMGGQSFDTGVQFSVGEWHEVGLSYTGTGSGDGWVYVYVDGKRKGAFLPGAIGGQQVLYLGSGLGGTNRFRGQFDHVEFWDHPADEATFATLSNVAPSGLPGDYTGDGSVDAADYVVWRKAQGQSVTPGTLADGTGNGLIDAEDYSLWTTNFGRTQSPPAAAAVVNVAIATVMPVGTASPTTDPEYFPIGAISTPAEVPRRNIEIAPLIVHGTVERSESFADLERRHQKAITPGRDLTELNLLASRATARSGRAIDEAFGDPPASSTEQTDEWTTVRRDSRTDISDMLDALARDLAIQTNLNHTIPRALHHRGT